MLLSSRASIDSSKTPADHPYVTARLSGDCSSRSAFGGP
jgi:hypothetical protein